MATKLEQAARRALEALEKAEMVYAVRDVHPMAVKQVEDAITALQEALDHSADTGKMVVPNGYALVSIDALKAWGKYDEVRNACQYPAEQAEHEPVMITPGGGAFPFAVVGELEQAEQEPVIGAYEVVNEKGDEWSLVYPAAVHRYKSIPEERITQTFYAAPVRTKDLTEPLIDELRECRDLLMCVESCSRNNFENLAYERVQAIDAVIAVDREKNK